MAILEQLLKDLIDEHDAGDDFHEDTPGEWNFYIDNNHSMSLMQDGQNIRFSCQIADTPKRLSSLETLLNANYLGIATYGNVLALDSSGDTVILRRELPGQTDYPRFEEAFEDFLNNAIHWIEFLSESTEKEVAQI